MGRKESLDFATVMGFCGKVLVAGGGYRDGFFEKLREASPMSDKTSASWL